MTYFFSLSDTQFLRALFSSFGFRYIWPWGKWSALSHDSYTCQKFPRTQAFPTQRILEKNNFVAAVISANDVLLEECPEKCRPKNHPDWKYC